MLEDEQRFEELESKLAALSSQVEGLELEKEIDPFFEDDVRRLIEDFREKEIVDVEEDEESFDSEDSAEPDFIDVQTTGGRTFKVHWIAPDSCEEMTKAKARAAFAAGAASRYGTSQQVNGGDVLILLCRKPTESESSEPEPLASFCHYIGMAVNTGLNPTSLEPDTSDEEAITSAVGNYEIFVWSSCECSGETPEPVNFTSLISLDNTSGSGSYLKLGGTGSFSPSSAEIVTDISLDTGELQSPEDAMSAVALKDSTKTTKQSGFKTKLVNLSESLTENYINHVSKNLTLQGDTQNLIGGNFNTSQYQSKNLELSSTECGSLEAVSISGESYDLNLLGLADDDSGFTEVIKSADISLGEPTDSQNTIPSYRATAEDIEDENNAFIPILSDADADAIKLSDSFSTRDVASVSISTNDQTNAPLKDSVITLKKSGSSKSFASGLLKEQSNLAGVSISTAEFPVIDRNHVQKWNGYGVSGIELFSPAVQTDEEYYNVSLGLKLNYKELGFETGLLNHVGDEYLFHPQSVSIAIPKGIDHETESQQLASLSIASQDYTNRTEYLLSLKPQAFSTKFTGGSLKSLGFEEKPEDAYKIEVPKGQTDNAVSIASDLSFTGIKKTVTDEGVTVSLGAYWNSHQSEFDAGLFKGDSVDIPQSSESSFDLEITDLVSLGNPGTAGSYIKDLQNLSGSGHYQSGGSMDLQLEFSELRSQLGFNDSGFFTGEGVDSSTSQSVSIHVPAMNAVTFPSIGTSGLANVDSLQDLTLTPVDGGFTLHARYTYNQFNFQKGLFLNLASGTDFQAGDMGYVSLGYIPFPEIPTGINSTISEHQLSSFQVSIAETDEEGTTYKLTYTPEQYSHNFDDGLLKSVSISSAAPKSVSIVVPKGVTDDAVSIASDLSFTGLKKTITDEGVTVSLGASWNSHYSQFTDGLFKGDFADIPQSSESSFDLEITDLVDLGNPGTAGDYIKQLKDLSGSGHYNDGGSMDLQLEFNELRSQLGFNDSGFYIGEISVSSTNSSVSINVPAMSMSTFPSLGQTDSVNVPKIANLRLQSEADGFKLFGTVDTTELSFTKGLFQQSSDSSAAEISLGSIAFPSFPEIPTGEDSTISEHQLSSFQLVSIAETDGTTYKLTYTPEQYSHKFEGGLLKSVSISSADSEPVSIVVPKGIDSNQSTIDLASLEISEPETNSDGDTNYTITLTPKNYSSNFEGGLLKSLNVSTGASQEVSFTIPNVSLYSPSGENVSISTTELFSDFTAEKDPDASGGTKYIFSLTPKQLAAEFEDGLTKDFTLNTGTEKQVSIFIPAPSIYTPDGTSEDHTPSLFKTTVSVGTPSDFYQKRIDIFSSTDALIDFDKGLAVSLHSPAYEPDSSLSIDASNFNTDDHTVRDISSIDVRGIYDVIHSSEGTGEARYYIDYHYKDITTTINNGLVTDIAETALQTVTKGPIVVRDAPLRYSCDPVYGCQPDPAGEYDEDTCGGGCTYGTYLFPTPSTSRTVFLYYGSYQPTDVEENIDLSVGGEDYKFVSGGIQEFTLEPDGVLYGSLVVPSGASLPYFDNGSYVAYANLPGWSSPYNGNTDINTGTLINPEDIIIFN